MLEYSTPPMPVFWWLWQLCTFNPSYWVFCPYSVSGQWSFFLGQLIFHFHWTNVIISYWELGIIILVRWKRCCCSLKHSILSWAVVCLSYLIVLSFVFSAMTYMNCYSYLNMCYLLIETVDSCLSFVLWQNWNTL